VEFTLAEAEESRKFKSFQQASIRPLSAPSPTILQLCLFPGTAGVLACISPGQTLTSCLYHPTDTQRAFSFSSPPDPRLNVFHVAQRKRRGRGRRDVIAAITLSLYGMCAPCVKSSKEWHCWVRLSQSARGAAKAHLLSFRVGEKHAGGDACAPREKRARFQAGALVARDTLGKVVFITTVLFEAWRKTCRRGRLRSQGKTCSFSVGGYMVARDTLGKIV